mgnify:FL=1
MKAVIRATGPVTPEGKAIVSLNAVRHGLLSRQVLLKAESKKSLCELATSLKNELNPVGTLESILGDRIISSVWRLRRAIKVESIMIGEDKDMGEKFKISYKYGNTLSKHLRYEVAIERQVYRALHELIRLQMARKGRMPPAPLAIDIDVSNGP